MSEGAGRAGWRVGSIDFRASRRSIRYIVRYTHLREQAAQVAEAEGPTERKCPRTTRLVTEADQKVRRRRRIARAAPADNRTTPGVRGGDSDCSVAIRANAIHGMDRSGSSFVHSR